MAASIESWPVRLPGGRIERSVLLVLHGAPAAEVRRLHRWAGRLAPHREVLAVDGGYDSCRAARVRVDRFVGDGDSVRRPPDSVAVERYDGNKDFSDLAGGLRWLRADRADLLVVAGALGGRVDHEWANLGELTDATRFHRGILASGERGGMVLTRRGVALQTPGGVRFSLFAAGPATSMTLRGARWPLHRARLRRPSHGLSNVTTGALELRVHAGAARLVFPRSSV